MSRCVDVIVDVIVDGSSPGPAPDFVHVHGYVHVHDVSELRPVILSSGR